VTAAHFELLGVENVSYMLTSAQKRANDDMAKLVKHYGMLLRTRVMAAASGRPGPRAITGDYRRSWTMEYRSVAGGGTAIVGTSSPQGRRLEFGFHGADSLGRVYNQPPYPHARPAFDKTAPEFEAAGDAMVLGWFGL